jgi:hypothetical protein
MGDNEGNEAKDLFMLIKIVGRVGPCMHVLDKAGSYRNNI